jgi:Fe-S-cluster-containing dehydrogenase component
LNNIDWIGKVIIRQKAMEFNERSIKVSIDTSKCPACESKACIAACKTYDRGILQLENGLPSVSRLTQEEVKRRGTECLACEYACRQWGMNVIQIEIPIRGLAEYLRGEPLSKLITEQQ